MSLAGTDLARKRGISDAVANSYPTRFYSSITDAGSIYSRPPVAKTGRPLGFHGTLADSMIFPFYGISIRQGSLTGSCIKPAYSPSSSSFPPFINILHITTHQPCCIFLFPLVSFIVPAFPFAPRLPVSFHLFPFSDPGRRTRWLTTIYSLLGTKS